MREQIGRENELFSGELRGHSDSDSAAVEDQILRRKSGGEIRPNHYRKYLTPPLQ